VVKLPEKNPPSEETHKEISQNEREVELIELHIENELKRDKSQILIDEEIRNLIDMFWNTKRNKNRASLLDKLSDNLESKDVREFLIEVVEKDNYPLCRAKALTNLGFWIKEGEIQNIVLKGLKDISPKVRLWALWTLRPIINIREIQDVLITHLKFYEKSIQNKLWIIRILSDQINDPYIQETFLYFFKLKPDVETRKLLLYYLLPRIHNEDIMFTISRHVQSENNREIRLEIVKKLILVDEPDVKYLLERMSKTEKNQEILDLLKSNS